METSRWSTRFFFLLTSRFPCMLICKDNFREALLHVASRHCVQRQIYIRLLHLYDTTRNVIFVSTQSIDLLAQGSLHMRICRSQAVAFIITVLIKLSLFLRAKCCIKGLLKLEIQKKKEGCWKMALFPYIVVLKLLKHCLRKHPLHQSAC